MPSTQTGPRDKLTVSVKFNCAHMCLRGDYHFLPVDTLTGEERPPIWLDGHLEPIDIQGLDHDEGIVAKGKLGQLLLFLRLCFGRLGHLNGPVAHILVPAVQRATRRHRAAPSGAHLLIYGIEKLASFRLPVKAGCFEGPDSRKIAGGGRGRRWRCRECHGGMTGRSENPGASSDAELVQGSIDPPGELDTIGVRYLLDLRSTNVGRGDQKGESGAGGWHEEGTMDVRANVGLARFVDSGYLVH